MIAIIEPRTWERVAIPADIPLLRSLRKRWIASTTTHLVTIGGGDDVDGGDTKAQRVPLSLTWIKERRSGRQFNVNKGDGA
jgi:hypothetical protein